MGLREGNVRIHLLSCVESVQRVISLPRWIYCPRGAGWALIPAKIHLHLPSAGRPWRSCWTSRVPARRQTGIFGKLPTPMDGAHSLIYVCRFPAACVTIYTCTNIMVSVSEQCRCSVAFLMRYFKTYTHSRPSQASCIRFHHLR